MGLFKAAGKEKLIVVSGHSSYGNPFYSFGRVTSSLRLLIKTPEEVEAVIFTGGEDVSPYLYEGVECGASYASAKRDDIEKKIFSFCKCHHIKMIGICRGLQFLNVMAGGKMYQHVDRHAGVNHIVVYPALTEKHAVNSLHHQMISLAENAIPIAKACPNRCEWGIDAYGKHTESPDQEMEAAVFPKDMSLGVQFHPEIMRTSDQGRIFFIEMVKDFLKMGMEDFVQKYGYLEEKQDAKKKSVSHTLLR